MLRELHISNLAVIQDVTLTLSEGLNCFTGQTGAGKSLVLGAFEILLGLKSGSDMVRPGAAEARVSGVFELRDEEMVSQISKLADAPLELGEPLLLTRKIFASGRSSVSVNGHPATTGMVRQIGEWLVDVHGQYDHQYLLKPGNQLAIIDAYAHCTPLREKFSNIHAQLRELIQRRTRLLNSSTLRQQQLELYSFQANELQQADLVAGEFEELKSRHALLSNVTKIKSQAGTAHAALYDSDGSTVERLQMIVHVLVDLGEHDKELAAIAEQIRTATLGLQESAYELGRYVDRLEVNPDELTQINERLNLINRLASKYAGKTPGGKSAKVEKDSSADVVSQLLNYQAQVEKELNSLRGLDQDQGEIDKQITAWRKELSVLGSELSAARKAAAKELKPLIEAELKELGMAEAQLEVSFETVNLEETIASKNENGDGEDDSEQSPENAENMKDSAGSSSGLDRVEILVRTNPGQPARPLRKIASGGELSRIMLALKSILAQSDRVSVLVFDEIDANIGGRMGTVIGQKLRQLAHHAGSGSKYHPEKSSKKTGKKAAAGKEEKSSRRQHQIVCITHLPQIAAYADRHVRIAKAVVGKGESKETRTTVTVLEGDARIEELAEMLAGKGVSDTTRKQVREMMDAV